MGALLVHFRLFLGFAVLFSLALLPATWVFLENSGPVIESDWAQNEAWVLARIQQKAQEIPAAQRKQFVLNQAHLIHGQLRWLGESGAVLMTTKQGAAPGQVFGEWPSSSEFTTWLTNHSSPGLPGYPPRISAFAAGPTTAEQVIFKVPLTQNPNAPATLLMRLAVPGPMQAEWQSGIRNGLAIALSLAMIMVLLWLVFYMGPQRRLIGYLQELGEGDLGTPMPDQLHSLQSVGEQLAQLAFRLRRRVAGAHEPSVVLEQFIESLPSAVIVWDGYDSLLAANGLARRLMGFHHPEGQDQVKNWVSQPHVVALIKRAEAEAHPVSATLHLSEPIENEVFGKLHVLKRPQEKAFIVFVSADFLSNPPRFLAADDRVEPIPFYKLWRRALRMAKPLFKKTNNELVVADKLPGELVAEVQGRLYWALAIVLVTIAATLRDHTISFDVQAKRNAVLVTFGCPMEKQVAQLLTIILSPVGGQITISHDEVVLWLPRA